MALFLAVALGLAASVQHLTIATSASATAVKPGSKLTLFVDVTPDAGIHVYAPGAGDYVPIKLFLKAQAGVVTGRVAYPKSEMLFFEPLKALIPVYQKPFRLAEDVTIGKTVRKGTKLTLTGKVDYQACDDHVCFIPASVPVTWTVDVQ